MYESLTEEIRPKGRPIAIWKDQNDMRKMGLENEDARDLDARGGGELWVRLRTSLDTKWSWQ